MWRLIKSKKENMGVCIRNCEWIKIEKLTTEKIAGIYILDFASKLYFGESGDVMKRIKWHLNSCRRGRHPNNLVQEEYSNSKGEVRLCYIKEDGSRKEREALEETLTCYAKGLNISLNKQSGARMGDEQKIQMSEARTGSGNPMFGKTGSKCHNFGKTASDETKAKLSETKKGSKNPSFNNGKLGDEKIIEIIKILIKGWYRVQADISKEFGVKQSTISMIKTGYFKGTGDYSRFYKIKLN